jgi:hypothetical protein
MPNSINNGKSEQSPMKFKSYLKEESGTTLNKSLWIDAGVLKIYWVDGNEVRKLDLEFTEGGHHFRYNFIPFGEIWIERMLNPAEEPFTLIHEMTEFINMAYKADYNTAHKFANNMEKYYRGKLLITPPPPPPAI